MPVKESNKQKSWMIKFWLPVFLCISFIFFASSIPGNSIPRLFPFQSSLFHLSVYLCLCFFLIRALRKSHPNIAPAKVIVFTIVFGVIYGIIDELHQAFVPFRTVSGFDLFIDSLGSVIGSLIYR